MVSRCKVIIRGKKTGMHMNTPTFSDPALCRCYVIGRISNTSIDANNSIDTTGKARGREGGKQLSTDKIYLNNHLELRNLTISSYTCICKVYHN